MQKRSASLSVNFHSAATDLDQLKYEVGVATSDGIEQIDRRQVSAILDQQSEQVAILRSVGLPDRRRAHHRIVTVWVGSVFKQETDG